jgi:hypothetical protein
MACISEDNDWKASEGLDRACPVNDRNASTILKCVSFDKMSQDENDEIANGNQSNDAGVLERV